MKKFISESTGIEITDPVIKVSAIVIQVYPKFSKIRITKNVFADENKSAVEEIHEIFKVGDVSDIIKIINSMDKEELPLP